LFSVFEYRRNLQPAAEFFVSFVDQKTLGFGYRCFEQCSGGRPHINRIKISSVLAIRRVSETKSLESKFDVALYGEIFHFKCTMMNNALSVRPGSLGKAWLQQKVDDTAASTGSNLVTDATPVDAPALSAPSVLHKLVGTFGISK